MFQAEAGIARQFSESCGNMSNPPKLYLLRTRSDRNLEDEWRDGLDSGILGGGKVGVCCVKRKAGLAHVAPSRERTAAEDDIYP